MQDDDKRQAAIAAVDEVRDGMLIGLGTGSTARHAIAAIGARVAQGLRIRAVATSLASERQALGLGIPLLPFEEVSAVDLTIDGADEIDGALNAIKGAGGAMLREKIVAEASARMVVIADGTKAVPRIGGAPVPLEVIAFAQAFVEAAVRRLGGDPVLRLADDAPYRTDNGNPVLDCRFGTIADPAWLAAELDRLPGVLGHGLFVREVDGLYVARAGSVNRIDRTVSPPSR
jgi:ribose 5-phosphate isomerase A